MPNFATLPTTAPECHDTERRSLVKINKLLDSYVNGGGAGGGTDPTSLDDLIAAVKGEDAILATSAAFVSHFTLFTGAVLLYQLDCFSIANSLRWVFIQDSASISLGLMPLYISPLYPRESTSFQIQAPFQRGVTVGLSTAPNTYVEDPVPGMLVTAVRRS